MELLDLNWDDVLHRHVLPNLSMADLFHLRAVSTGCRDLVHSYFSNALELDVSQYSEQMTTEAFNVSKNQMFVSTKEVCLITVNSMNIITILLHFRFLRQIRTACKLSLVIIADFWRTLP